MCRNNIPDSEILECLEGMCIQMTISINEKNDLENKLIKLIEARNKYKQMIKYINDADITNPATSISIDFHFSTNTDKIESDQKGNIKEKAINIIITESAIRAIKLAIIELETSIDTIITCLNRYC